MSVSFYLHTPLPDDSNEWPAVARLTRLMKRHFTHDAKHYDLIFNIQPNANIRNADGKKLTQLDALLIAPKFVSIIELKRCFKPIHAESLGAPWLAGADEFQLKGGNAENPFLQVQYARQVWATYLAEKCAFRFSDVKLYEWKKRWAHLSVFLLLFPFLHPDSSLPPLETASKWLAIRGINDLGTLVFHTHSPNFDFPPDVTETLVTKIFNAQPWPELDTVQDEQIGSLFIYEPSRPLIRMPLYKYDDISIGRSSSQQVRIHSQFRRISKAHARIEVQNGQVRLFDVGSTNGTFVGSKRLADEDGYLLGVSEKALLGTKTSQKAVQIWYTLHTIEGAEEKTLYGTLETEDR
ncbi:MAG: FHA domain-containing protein [Anaerolineales bacterium]|nr:FHA domain-containing protein [Anaerolineales bacterium]